MRRACAGLDHKPDGTWIIAPDYLDRAKASEQRRVEAAPVVVRTLTTVPLERQIGADGATWLDRRLVREAEARRRQWLVAEGLAQEAVGQVNCRADMLATLRHRELARVGNQLAKEVGLGYPQSGASHLHVRGLGWTGME
jgi:hypothetical protein